MVRGAREVTFALVAVALFGLAYGIAARDSGLEIWMAMLTSALLFAGASQFAALDLWQSPVAWLPLIIVIFAVNARHILMGAALYPWLGQLTLRQQLTSAALMTDINWAQSMQAFDRGERDGGHLLGAGMLLWVTWLASTGVGAAMAEAATIDLDRFGVDLTFLLFFVCMLKGLRRGRRDDLAWLVAGATALVAAWILPQHWHVIGGALAGGIAGLLADTHTERRAAGA